MPAVHDINVDRKPDFCECFSIIYPEVDDDSVLFDWLLSFSRARFFSVFSDSFNWELWRVDLFSRVGRSFGAFIEYSSFS